MLKNAMKKNKKNKKAKKQTLKRIFMSVVSVLTLVVVVLAFTARRNVVSMLQAEQKQAVVEQPTEPVEQCDSIATDSLAVEPTVEPTAE